MNYYIITFSKVHHKITEEFKNKILKSDASSFELEDKSIVKINSISDILPEDKYFQTYPDKRPEDTRNQFEEQYPNQQFRKPTTFQSDLINKGFIKAKIEMGMTKEQAEKDFNNLTTMLVK